MPSVYIQLIELTVLHRHGKQNCFVIFRLMLPGDVSEFTGVVAGAVMGQMRTQEDLVADIVCGIRHSVSLCLAS